MKFIKRVFDDFHEFRMKLPRFCLSYERLKQKKNIAFKTNTILIGKRMADTDFVNDVTCMRPKCYLHVWAYDLRGTMLSSE